jgi:hypothetical protein
MLSKKFTNLTGMLLATEKLWMKKCPQIPGNESLYFSPYEMLLVHLSVFKQIVSQIAHETELHIRWIVVLSRKQMNR